MNKTKPIRIFVCPLCGKTLVRKTKQTSLSSYCLSKETEYRGVKLIAYGKQQRTN